MIEKEKLDIRTITMGISYSIQESLSITDRVCSLVNVGCTKAGINMDAVRDMGFIIKRTALLTKDRDLEYC